MYTRTCQITVKKNPGLLMLWKKFNMKRHRPCQNLLWFSPSALGSAFTHYCIFLKFFLRSCFLHKPWFHFCYNSSSFGISVALCAGTVGKNTPVHLKNRFYVEYGLWRIIQSLCLYCCVEGKTVMSRRNVILIKNLTYLGLKHAAARFFVVLTGRRKKTSSCGGFLFINPLCFNTYLWLT